ncbi:MAG: FlgD immunoglobulin-like domain containing protein [Candidatus Eisenbacteria bacterium]
MPRGFVAILALSALLALFPGPAQAWYPRTVQVELGTATWCSNCIYAYQGIEENKDGFDPDEFNAVRYYANSGGLGAPISTDRIAYYGTRFPEAVFDGTSRIAAGDTDFADGLYYRSTIQRLLCEPSHFKITIDSSDFTAPEGAIDLDIEVMETLPDITNLYLRMILTEDDVVYALETYQDVTRAQVGGDVALTVQTEGQIQHVAQTFPIDAGWNGAKLKIVAFIQDDDDQAVETSACTTPASDYTFRFYALSPRVEVGPITPTHHYAPFRLYNTGSETDLFIVNVDTDAPPGWVGVLCRESGCIGPYYETVLDPGQYEDLYVDLQAATSGYGNATVEIWQDSRPERVGEIKYTYITDDLDVLIVDDDGARQHETYYADALEHYGFTYGIWDHDAFGAPPAADMAAFDAVVWSHGRVFPSVDAADRAALAAYLDDGGRLLISGENLGWELDDEGGDAYLWYQDYLHASYFAGNTGDYTLTGVAGDPISDGIDITIQGGDGANNQTSPDDIDPEDAAATVIWKFDANKNGALRIETVDYRAVYLAFGFEAIDNASQRRGILNRILGWFQGLSDVAGDEGVVRPTLRLAPNPAPAGAHVRFTLAQSAQVKLRLFAPDGRLVRTLVDGRLDAGSHAFDWNRLDEVGDPVPTGVYYCRLSGEQTELVRTVVLIQ